jgi:hypothetical protein
MKKLMETVADLLSPNDPELVRKTLARIEEQDRWNDVFSTKLIELLDTNDLLKSTVRATGSQLEAAAELCNRAEKTVQGTESLLSAAEIHLLAAERQLSIATRKDRDAETKLVEAKSTYRNLARSITSTFGVLTFLLLTAQALITTSQPIRSLIALLAIADICFVGFYHWSFRQNAE